MVSFGMLLAYALSMARRSRGFIDGSAPPRRAATVISLMRRVKILPRFASVAAFLCLMFAHLLWPAMVVPLYVPERRIVTDAYERDAYERLLQDPLLREKRPQRCKPHFRIVDLE